MARICSARPLWAVIVVLPLVACAAAGRWENPNVPREQWARDRDACRAQARAAVEKEYGREELLGRGEERRYRLDQQMARYEAEKRTQYLNDQCMRRLGYHRAKAGEKR